LRIGGLAIASLSEVVQHGFLPRARIFGQFENDSITESATILRGAEKIASGVKNKTTLEIGSVGGAGR
jgi:hypothetical protein